jgi:para-nitrobenzyl esterase
MRLILSLMQLVAVFSVCAMFAPVRAQSPREVMVESGTLQGALNDDKSVLMFKGVPFAAPPVGDLRWKPPQPAAKWKGVRKADKFGPACLQTDVYGDIFFRDVQPSEDCLNLAIWMPAKPADAKKIPVLVWFYGGGFVAGGNSEKRYDGENLARKGIMVVSPNYRLQIFGFFSHPELAKESPVGASGNYGLLDQAAALRWVIKNIAAFGGDPKNITIAGESAGSQSVSALMASPLSRDLFQRAMGESGAFFTGPTGGARLKPHAVTEQDGLRFAELLGAKSLAELRAKPAQELLEAAAKKDGGFHFGPNVDGYFLPSDVQSIFARGDQSHVPLLAGWNADEDKMAVLGAPEKTTTKTFAATAKERFRDQAAEFLKLYPADTDEQAVRSAEDLAGDDFMGFSVWKWLEMQLKTGQSPVYRYLFAQTPASKPGQMEGTVPLSELGARHAGEIEYVFETLKLTGPDLPWTPEDFKVSEAMATYWTNFVKSGNPNGEGMADWPKYGAGDGYQYMVLSGMKIGSEADARRGRYLFLEAEVAKKAPMSHF